MTDNPRPNVRRVFLAVAELVGAERAEALSRLCGADADLRREVETLLHVLDHGSTSIDDPTVALPSGPPLPETLAATDGAPGSSAQSGQMIGRYKLLQEIGEGGFGTVWMAEQREPVKRRVALKIIKLGMDTKQVIARFEAERQALALMDHQHIAKVFDAGSTETGRPYFVMEYIRGIPILEYCDAEKLDTRARLALFTQVCGAIQHAHQKGIIHRDIKPSNVLVTLNDGTPLPKVIDFGIAKATDTELTQKTLFTEHRQIVGTPAYMSPEQAEMTGLDIDTRSDIYSLGVLLYELLTGTTPFPAKSLLDGGLAEMMRIIREDEPHKPSTRLSSLGDTGTRTAELRRTDFQKLRSTLRGDLDWIVMKCLEKDRTRRYESASSLAADIDRHLKDEPVLASPPSTAYRLKKFTKRNKGKVVAGSAFLVLLVGGFIAMLILYQWAVTERAQVVAQAKRAADALRVVTDEFSGTMTDAEEALVPAEPGDEVEALAATAVHLVRSLDASNKEAQAARLAEATRATELAQVASFQSEQLSTVDAEVMGTQLRDSILDASPEEGREALKEHFAAINFTSLALETLEKNLFEQTIEAINTQFADQPLVCAHLLQTTANTMHNVGLLDLATAPQKRALELRRELLGDDDPVTVSSVLQMGELLAKQGKHADAEPFIQESLDTRRRLLGNDHVDTLQSLSAMATLLQRQGKLKEAEPHMLEALEGLRLSLGDDHYKTLTAIYNLGVLMQMQGRVPDAEPYYREALETRRRVLGPNHPDTLVSVSSMGLLLTGLGEYDKGEPYFREVLEVRRRVLGDEHPETLDNLYNLSVLCQMQGKLSEAETLCREALETRRRVLGNNHVDTIQTLTGMGSLLHSQGRLSEAEPLFREALEASKRVLGDEHPTTLLALSNMGGLIAQQGRLADAEPHMRETLETSRRVLGPDHPQTATALINLGWLLTSQQKFDDAEGFLSDALEIHRRTLGSEHPETLHSAHVMGEFLAAQGKLDDAEPYFREALEGRQKALGEDHPDTQASASSLEQLLELRKQASGE